MFNRKMLYNICIPIIFFTPLVVVALERYVVVAAVVHMAVLVVRTAMLVVRSQDELVFVG